MTNKLFFKLGCFSGLFAKRVYKNIIILMVAVFVFNNSAYAEMLGLEIGKTTYNEAIEKLKSQKIVISSAIDYMETKKFYDIYIEHFELPYIGTNKEGHLWFDGNNVLYKAEFVFSFTKIPEDGKFESAFELLRESLDLKYGLPKTSFLGSRRPYVCNGLIITLVKNTYSFYNRIEVTYINESLEKAVALQKKKAYEDVKGVLAKAL